MKLFKKKQSTVVKKFQVMCRFQSDMPDDVQFRVNCLTRDIEQVAQLVCYLLIICAST